MSEPTAWTSPAAARALAAEADDLAQRVEAARTARDADTNEHRRLAGFRLDEVAGDLRRAARELLATADDLARLASAPEHACGLPFGVCPEHGNTLNSSGDQAWCRATGCGRRWGYNRVQTPCAEPVAFHVSGADGAAIDVCAGHAIDVRDRLLGAVVTPLAKLTRHPAPFIPTYRHTDIPTYRHTDR